MQKMKFTFCDESKQLPDAVKTVEKAVEFPIVGFDQSNARNAENVGVVASEKDAQKTVTKRRGIFGRQVFLWITPEDMPFRMKPAADWILMMQRSHKKRMEELKQLMTWRVESGPEGFTWPSGCQNCCSEGTVGYTDPLKMPADIDVLVTGSSSISFSSDYCSHDYNASPVILTSQPDNTPFASNGTPFDFPTALSSAPTPPQYIPHPPQVFGTSPPTHFTFHGRCSSPTLRSVSSPALTLATNFNQLTLAQMPVAVPRRPCLVVRCDVLDLPSANKSKKRVVFADDRGFPLTLVRTMSEPSNMPPKWSLQFLSRVTRTAPPEVPPEPWEVAFPQPASDYLDFRRRLDTNNVSLENVIVRESEQSVVGTVKVRNLAFHKEVFVRTTTDGWSTQEDAFCTYVPNSPPAHGVTVLYDTFSFRLRLPPSSRKVEFCVCYRCSGVEYWDNHAGKNYLIVKKDQGRRGSEESGKQKVINLSQRLSDVKPNAQVESWTEFASWNHLNNDTPYW